MRKTHYILGQNNKHETTTACGLRAGKDGIIHVPKRRANCKNCKRTK